MIAMAGSRQYRAFRRATHRVGFIAAGTVRDAALPAGGAKMRSDVGGPVIPHGAAAQMTE
jgi:hypothetical protein